MNFGCIIPKIKKIIQFYNREISLHKSFLVFLSKVKEFVGGKNCWSWILKIQFQHSLGLGFRSVKNMKVLV